MKHASYRCLSRRGRICVGLRDEAGLWHFVDVDTAGTGFDGGLVGVTMGGAKYATAYNA